MSGQCRNIKIHDSPERALEAEVANVDLAEAALASVELEAALADSGDWRLFLPTSAPCSLLTPLCSRTILGNPLFALDHTTTTMAPPNPLHSLRHYDGAYR